MAYASEQKFAGQVATAGRAVIVAVAAPNGETWIRAGVILGVSSHTDKVYIRDLGADGPIDYQKEWTFADVKTPGETKHMRPGEWAWPPRV